MKIYKTVYDSHFVVVSANGRIRNYEGYALCPASVKKRIDSGQYKEVNYFSFEFISSCL